MSDILIATDLHDTLVLSSSAWLDAFWKVSGKDRPYLFEQLSSKRSRKELAKNLNISYTKVYDEYRRLLKPNCSMIRLMQEFSENEIPIVIISSASSERVQRDVNDIKNFFHIDKVFSKENFRKSDYAHWQRLLDDYSSEWIIFFGNDKEEDLIQHEKVISILIIKEIDNENNYKLYE